MKRLLLLLLLGLCLLAGVLVVRALRFTSRQVSPEPPAPFSVDAPAAGAAGPSSSSWGDERVSVEGCAGAVRFYARLLRNAAG